MKFLPWSDSDPLPAERELRLAGWNRDRSALLVYAEQGERVALRLRLPSGFGLAYLAGGPVSSSDVVAIRRTALHLPPCRETREQAEALRRGPADWPPGPIPEAWERCAAHVLYPEPPDHRELRRRLAAYQKARRRDYDSSLRKIECQPPAERVEALRVLEAAFTTNRPTWRPGEPREFVKVFDLTLADVRAGALGLRDDFLIEQWAQRYGIDLAALRQDAREFRDWLASVAVNAEWECVNKPKAGQSLQLSEDQWAVLEASVRYEIRFVAAPLIWLAGVEETTKLTVQEAEDFTVLEEAEAVEGREIVPRAQCYKELKIGDRRFRQLLKDYSFTEPMTRRALDQMKRRHARSKRHAAKQVGNRNRSLKGKAQLP